MLKILAPLPLRQIYQMILYPRDTTGQQFHTRLAQPARGLARSSVCSARLALL
jgi:hypothetical protein